MDITCKVSGINGTTNGAKFVLSAVMPDTKTFQKVHNFWVVQGGTNSIDRGVRSNGIYNILWDAKADLGIVYSTNMVVRVTLCDGHEMVQLWEDGPYWATTNIGAEEPWESGYYFWWGDTIGYKRENNVWVASDCSSSFNFSFTSNNIPISNKNISILQSEGWISKDKVLRLEHDAAQVQWGGNWRIPTYQELMALYNECDWNWTILNGVNGYNVRGRDKFSSMSIFIPCAGRGYKTSIDKFGLCGCYLSSIPGRVFGSVYGIYFSVDYRFSSSFDCCMGQSIRPVQLLDKDNIVGISNSFVLNITEESFKTPMVVDVVAKQRCYEDRLVDITCKVSGISETTIRPKFALYAHALDSGNVESIGSFWVVRNGTNSTDRKVHTNGEYHLTWDAKADLGQVYYTNMVVRVVLNDAYESVQLWEGGPYWATTNVGAENRGSLVSISGGGTLLVISE